MVKNKLFRWVRLLFSDYTIDRQMLIHRDKIHRGVIFSLSSIILPISLITALYYYLILKNGVSALLIISYFFISLATLFILKKKMLRAAGYFFISSSFLFIIFTEIFYYQSSYSGRIYVLMIIPLVWNFGIVISAFLLSRIYTLISGITLLLIQAVLVYLSGDLSAIARLPFIVGMNILILLTALLLRQFLSWMYFSIQTEKSKVEEGEYRYRHIFNTMHDSLIISDREGNICDVNSYAISQYGYSKDEFLNLTIKDIVDTAYYDEVDRFFADLNMTGEFRTFSEEVRKDKSRFYAEVNAYNLEYRGEQHYLSIIRDITERKKMQDSLKEALINAEKMAREAENANRIKGEFLANMSHEIRTPMNGVLGMAQLMKKSDLNAEQERYTDLILHSGENLIQIINEILDFSKIETGKISLQIEEFNLRELISEILKIHGVRAQEKGIDCYCYMSSKIPDWIKGDPYRIRQVLVNLFGNSVKFTEKGYIVIFIDFATVPRKEIIIEIHDTGIGIPKEKKGLLFKPFEQLEGSSTRPYEGTGLGLAISKKLIQLMDGEIYAESPCAMPDMTDFGPGSTFRFRLPLIRGLRDKKDYYTFNKKKIKDQWIFYKLDIPVFNRLMKQLLDDWGFSSREFSIQENPFDMLQKMKRGIFIMDCNRSREENSEFIEKLGNFQKSHPEIEIRVISLIALTDRAEKTIQKGYDFLQFLYKPLLKNDLYQKLNDIVTKDKNQKVDEEAGPDVLCIGERRENNDIPRILLVEDNPVSRIVAEKMLQSLGCHVMNAENGKIAVEKSKEHDFSLILMDIQMPVMDGFSAAEKIKHKNPDIPILAMTANVLNEERKKAFESGMDDFISKPVSIHLLEEKLKHWIK